MTAQGKEAMKNPPERNASTQWSNFADRLQAAIQHSQSFIVAGFDPRLEDFPPFILQQAKSRSESQEDAIYNALISFYSLALEASQGAIAAVKPNIAFFEQYGLAGLRAFAAIVNMARERQVLVIADVKRGDIGSTAQAYSAAYLGRSSIFGERTAVFDADAITVSPFLGFDTVQTFFKDCAEYGKGIFVLVKTSNPGSGDIQALRAAGSGEQSLATGQTVSERLAIWLDSQAPQLMGSSGFSALGAVVGATYPEEARRLRELMPRNLFLIPGMGAQGGSAQDAAAGFARHPQTSLPGGALINLSRGLFGSLPAPCLDQEQLTEEIRKRLAKFNQQIAQALQ